jgi:hypothetical protein
MTKKAHIIQLLQNGTPPHKVAATVPCSKSYVHLIRRRDLGHRTYKRPRTTTHRLPTTLTDRRCARCTFSEEIPTNPIDDTGLCLYCRLQANGTNLLTWHETGRWTDPLLQQGDTP